MKRYAQLYGNIVHSVIESDTDPDGINGEWIECGNAGPGYIYEGGNFSPPLPTTETPSWILSRRAFKNRFPRAKWNAARMASATDHMLYDFFESFQLAGQIDLKNEEIMMAMVMLSVDTVPDAYRLTGNEVDMVLTVPASPAEAP